jgi:hypothetical protein
LGFFFLGGRILESPRMQASIMPMPSGAPRNYSTKEAAATLHVKPQTLRAALCRDGHYFGLRPVKCRNRLLLWDATAVEALAAGEALK